MTRFNPGEATDVGQVRDNNQDLALILEPSNLFAVADGMGGHNGGETAAKVAIETLRDNYDAPTLESLVTAMQTANEVVVSTALDDPDLAGMGTTLCVLAGITHFGEDVVAVASVGDSRAYLIEGTTLRQITRDHTLVQMLVDQGQLSAAEAESHPQRNILTRALGIDEKVMVDSFLLRPVLGDRYLLCSDGLFGEVSDEQIHDVLRQFPNPSDAARELVEVANASGGRDNITCVVVDVVEGVEGIADGADRLISSETGQHRLIAGLAVGAPAPEGDIVEDEGDIVEDEGDSGPAPDEAGAAPEPAGTAPPATTEAAAPSRPTTVRPAESVEGDVPHRFTWRSALYVVLVLVALFLAFGATAFYARSTYYVGLDDGRVAIFRGRPGGVLWFGPTVAQTSTIEVTTLPDNLRREVEDGKDEPTLADARRYLAMLEAEAGPVEEVEGSDQPVAGRGPTRTLPPVTTVTTVAPPVTDGAGTE